MKLNYSKMQSESIPGGINGCGDTGNDTKGNFIIVRRKYPGRWVFGILIAFVLSMLLSSFITNERFGWHIVFAYLFDKSILIGLLNTLILTVTGMGLGLFAGIIIAIMKMSTNPLSRGTANVYIWFFRGTPLLVQLIFFYNLAALYPVLSLGIPYGPQFISAPTNFLINVWTAAILGLAFHEAAYVAEIIRGGFLGVPIGQVDGARAIGMSEFQIFRKILWPQAVRLIIPPIGNEVIRMLKGTAQASVIALPELLYSAQLIYTTNFRTIPLLIVVCIWYLAVVSILSIAQKYLENRYNKGQVAGSL